MSQVSSRNQGEGLELETVHHRSRRGRRQIEPAKMQLNFTAMIDVIFLLLVYFVVIANFSPGEGVLTAKLPKGTAGNPVAPKPIKPLIIALRASGAYGRRIEIQNVMAVTDFAELASRLSTLRYDPISNPNGQYKPDWPLLIKPDRKVRWQHVVNAFNAAVRAKFENVSFAQVKSE